MRTGKVWLAGLMMVLAAAGCAAPDDDGDGVATAQTGAATAAASPSAAATFDEDAPLKYAQCMREHGMTWFPDPQPDGRMMIKTPKGLDPTKFEAAREACQEFAPEGGEGGQPDPELIEKARQMAKCMRENGVPEFPDPQADGSLQLDRGKMSVGPGDPAFDKAEQKCSKFMPDGGPRTTREGAGGSGVTA
ncbi:hypothetical protein Aab01nite_71690 [Paractinoplanes abujensis]|uniref:Lipoprotein n=1 Tax=Paractinoplanes abujensis TaxID=882441 RepID=A0A7W7CWQ7_9ACTN|nr:hypothetical protein [Actinoplanes abujensis]MBB4694850.1 hypothetical protein [Actinoplanes abujensis]GID23579.1 hypothetical protein Aab01nite_71690 [Actinoplanes abujensis]